MSQIESIEFGTPGGVSGQGTLLQQVTALLDSNVPFTGIFIHEGRHLTLKQPRRIVIGSVNEITKDDIHEFFDFIEPDWKERIKKRAFDRAGNLGKARVRINGMMYGGGKRHGAVVRRFPAAPIPLDQLGLRADERAFANLRKGLVLIVGDTHQGKSTTMASYLDEFNNTRSGHILTIEDPVEIVHVDKRCVVTQREVGNDVDSFFVGGLDAMRQQPEIIGIGEIRDAETAGQTVGLGEAGPFVLASLHAKTPELALIKMVRLMGGTDAHAQLLAQVLKGIVCQSLLPSASGDGYHLATECLTVTPEIARMIETRNFGAIRPALETQPGCHTMNGSLMALFKDGKITVEDAKHATTDPVKFEPLFKSR